MAYWKRLLAMSGVASVCTYYSPWIYSGILTCHEETSLGRSWEMIKQREDQFRTTRWLVRPVRSPWWNASRSRLNYYLFGPDTLTPVGSQLPKGKEAVEEWIDYQSRARIRPLGPWFDAFSDPRSLAVLDEYTKTTPAIMNDKIDQAPDFHYKTSYGGATLPEGRPRGVSIGAFLYDEPGFAKFYDECKQEELDTWKEIEMTVEDPEIREGLKHSITSFRQYWGEQLEEFLPYIACRPKQKEKLSKFLMAQDTREKQNEIGSLMIQKDGCKKLLLAAGCDLSLE